MTMTPAAPHRRTGKSKVRTRRPTEAKHALGTAPASPGRARRLASSHVVRQAEEPQARRHAYLIAALWRCAVYLCPLSVAVAATHPLCLVAWPVPIVTLLLGWPAAQALTSVGVVIARRDGPEAAARLVGCGFLAVVGVWCALVWVAPDALVGANRGLALVIGVGGLASLATVTVALVTRSEAAIVRWSLPCWLLGAASLLGHPPELLLPAAIVVVVIRAFRPVGFAGCVRPHRLDREQLQRAGGYLVIGASQAVCVGLLWRVGPSGSTTPFWLPLLLAVPILEALIGWHTSRLGSARRWVVTVITVAAMLPPLVAGVVLAVTAWRMTGTSPAVTHDRAEVLALAGGTLLGGVFAITYLLAARNRTALAAVVAAAPPLTTAAVPLLRLPDGGALPHAVSVLALTHLAGLLLVARTAASPLQRRTS